MAAGLTADEVRRLVSEELRRAGLAAAAPPTGASAMLDRPSMQAMLFPVIRATRNALIVDLYESHGDNPKHVDALLDDMYDWTRDAQKHYMAFLLGAFDTIEDAERAWRTAAHDYIVSLASERSDYRPAPEGFKNVARRRIQSLEDFYGVFLSILAKSASLRRGTRPFFTDTDHADRVMRSAFAEAVSRSAQLLGIEQVPRHDDMRSIAPRRPRGPAALPRPPAVDVEAEREAERERERKAAEREAAEREAAEREAAEREAAERERERERERESERERPTWAPPADFRPAIIESATPHEDASGPRAGEDSQSFREREDPAAARSVRSQVVRPAMEKPRKIVSLTAEDAPRDPSRELPSRELPPPREESVRSSRYL